MQKVLTNPELLIARSLVGTWREVPVPLSPTPKLVTRTARLFLWQLFYPAFQSHHFLPICSPKSTRFVSFCYSLYKPGVHISLPSHCGLCDLLYPDPCYQSIWFSLSISCPPLNLSSTNLTNCPSPAMHVPATPLQANIRVFSTEKDCRKPKQTFQEFSKRDNFFLHGYEGNVFHYFSCTKLNISFKKNHIKNKGCGKVVFPWK